MPFAVRMNQGGEAGATTAPASAPVTAPAPVAAEPAVPKRLTYNDIVSWPQQNVPVAAQPETTPANPAAPVATPAPAPTGVEAVLAQTEAELFAALQPQTPAYPQGYPPAYPQAPAPPQAPAAPANNEVAALQAQVAQLQAQLQVQQASAFKLPDQLRAQLATTAEGKSALPALETVLGAAVQAATEQVRSQYDAKIAELEKRIAPVQETLQEQQARFQEQQRRDAFSGIYDNAVQPLGADPAFRWLHDEGNFNNPLARSFFAETVRFMQEAEQGRGVIQTSKGPMQVSLNPQVLRHFTGQLLQQYRAWIPNTAPAPNPSVIDSAQPAGAGAAQVATANTATRPNDYRQFLTPSARRLQGV